MGGLSRKAALLKQLAGRDHGPVLALDSGALLFKQRLLPPSRLPALRAEADGIIESYAHMGYTASGIAPQDLAGGIDYLIRTREKAGLTWLSMNLVRPTDEKPLFLPFIIKKIGAAKLAVLGLTDSSSRPNTKNQDPERYRILPWQEVLADTLTQVRGRAEMIIVLSSYPYSVNEQIARRFHNIHLILQSGHSATNIPPKKIGNTLICQAGGEGKYLGKMEIHWAPSHQWRENFTEQLNNTHNRLNRTNWQLLQIKQHFSRDQLTTNKQYQQLRDSANKLNKEITRLEGLQNQSGAGFCTYDNTFIGLRRSLPEDPEIKAIVTRTMLSANQINRNRLARLRRQHADRTSEANQERGQIQTSAMTSLAGWRVCRQCHPLQTKFWQKTAHAQAWQTLAKTQQQFNQDCLICHVTLPTYDRDTVQANHLLVQLKAVFNNVGCESCHGPGQHHAQQPKQIKLRNPDRTTCLTCHTGKHDKNFDFKRKVLKIHCPRSAQP